MKLAISFGAFNPPTVSDVVLFEKLASFHRHDTECVLLTNTIFDRDNPVGVSEKLEILKDVVSKNIRISTDYIWITKFLREHGHEYEEIIYVMDEVF